MGVETMKIMGIIAKKALLNKVLRLVISSGSMHMINALVRVNSTNIFLPPNEKNIKVLEELPFLKPYSSKRDFIKEEKIITSLLDLFRMEQQVKRKYLEQDYDYDDFMNQIFNIYKKVHFTANEIEKKVQSIEGKREYISRLKYLEKYDFNIGQLIYMKYLAFNLIKIPRENYDKLKKNYENIPAVILKVAVEGKEVILVSITPKTLEETLEKILSSLNYTLLPLPDKFKNTAIKIIEILNKEIDEELEEIKYLKKSLGGYKTEHISKLKMAYSRLAMEKKIEEYKSDLAVGDTLFFMFGFVPTGDAISLKNELEKQFGENIIILVDDLNETDCGITPPTKLRNIKFFKPFESLVKMYGTPAYHEKDPTVFFGITYMILFGAMFGDVGHGSILLFAGLILEMVLNKPDFGGLLSRIGFSSIIFGFIYGSVFGSEEIIHPLIMSPMKNINYILVVGVIFGIFLILSSYIYSIINLGHRKNIEEGIFGRSGLTGLALYLMLLYTIFSIVVRHSNLSFIMVCIMLGLLVIMVFKQPLTSKLTHADKLYKGSPADYYTEEGFGVLETLLSMLSNTVSFLRVGAFALNHAGLYIAFDTMAKMMAAPWESITILVIGNIIIIGLEGLIVFIQALRLEYYELFTKYFEGDGIEYVPARIKAMSLFKQRISLFNKKNAYYSVGNA